MVYNLLQDKGLPQKIMIIDKELNCTREGPVKNGLNRLLDYVCIIPMLIVFSIPMLMIYLILRLCSRDAIVKQQRMGMNGRPFTCYKFRTMSENAEEELSELLETDEEARAEWEKYRKLRNDPRVTRLGMFLRKTSLDELPQIVNVLKGEMSIVGPRPYLLEELDLLKGFADNILSVRPGITGLWQVSGRNDKVFEDRVSLDVNYVRHWSLWLDLVILLKTVKVVITGEGSY